MLTMSATSADTLVERADVVEGLSGDAPGMSADILFDQLGEELPADALLLSRKLSYTPISGVIDHAVRDLGFVRNPLAAELPARRVRTDHRWAASGMVRIL